MVCHPYVVTIIFLTAIAYGNITFAATQEEARDMALCNKGMADVMQDLANRFVRPKAELEAMEGQYGKLCTYGKTKGVRVYDQILRDLKIAENKYPACFYGIGDLHAIYRNMRAGYIKEVEKDCERAGRTPKKDASGLSRSLCGSIVSTLTEPIGFKNGNVNEVERVMCIIVENKCPYTIDFKVRRSDMPGTFQEFVESGKTGKICGNNESQSVSYVGMKKR